MLPTPDCSGSSLSVRRPGADLVVQEVQQVVGDLRAGLVDRGERAQPVRCAGFHDADDLGRVHAQVGLADALVGGGQLDRLAVRGQRGAVVDVVHALHGRGLLRVDLDDDLVGHVQPGLVVAHGGGRDQPAVLGHADDLDDRQVDLAVEAEPGVLGDMGQVDVHVFHLAGVDAAAQVRIRHVGQAQLHAAGAGQHAVQLRGRGGAGEHVDLEVAARGVLGFHQPGERTGDGLGVAGAGEAAHGHRHPRLHQGGGLLGRHQEVKELGVMDPIVHGCPS